MASECARLYAPPTASNVSGPKQDRYVPIKTRNGAGRIRRPQRSTRKLHPRGTGGVVLDHPSCAAVENDAAPFDGFEPRRSRATRPRRRSRADARRRHRGNRMKIRGCDTLRERLSEGMERTGPGFSRMWGDIRRGSPWLNRSDRRRGGTYPAETPVSRCDVQGAGAARLQIS